MDQISDVQERAALAFIERTNAFLPPDFATLDPDVVLVAVDGISGRDAHYRGHHGVREWLGDPAERAWSELHVHADEVRRQAGRLVVLGRITRRGRDSSLVFEDPFAVRFVFRHELIARIEAFMSHEAALRVEP